jgi:hypothetical protein
MRREVARLKAEPINTGYAHGLIIGIEDLGSAGMPESGTCSKSVRDCAERERQSYAADHKPTTKGISKHSDSHLGIVFLKSADTHADTQIPAVRGY